MLLNPYRFATGAATDPYWANVVLLMHMDGSDGSTTFTDQKGHAATAQGNAQLDTAEKKFGTASYLGDGAGDAVSFAESADFNGFGAADTWTVECFAKRPTQSTGSLVVLGDNAGGVQAQFSLETFGGQQYIYLRPEGGSTGYFKANAFVYTSNWQHYAFVSNAGSFAIYVDGTSVGALTSFSWTTSNMPYGCLIGANYNAGITSSFNGWIDEVRVTKGIARYTSNFTPPSAPFPDS